MRGVCILILSILSERVFGGFYILRSQLFTWSNRFLVPKEELEWATKIRDTILEIKNTRSYREQDIPPSPEEIKQRAAATAISERPNQNQAVLATSSVPAPPTRLSATPNNLWKNTPSDGQKLTFFLSLDEIKLYCKLWLGPADKFTIDLTKDEPSLGQQNQMSHVLEILSDGKKKQNTLERLIKQWLIHNENIEHIIFSNIHSHDMRFFVQYIRKLTKIKLLTLHQCPVLTVLHGLSTSQRPILCLANAKISSQFSPHSVSRSTALFMQDQMLKDTPLLNYLQSRHHFKILGFNGIRQDDIFSLRMLNFSVVRILILANIEKEAAEEICKILANQSNKPTLILSELSSVVYLIFRQLYSNFNRLDDLVLMGASSAVAGESLKRKSSSSIFPANKRPHVSDENRKETNRHRRHSI